MKQYCDMCEREIEVSEGTLKDVIQPVAAVLIREPQHEKASSMMVELCPRCYKIVKERFHRLFAAPEEETK